MNCSKAVSDRHWHSHDRYTQHIDPANSSPRLPAMTVRSLSHTHYHAGNCACVTHCVKHWVSTIALVHMFHFTNICCKKKMPDRKVRYWNHKNARSFSPIAFMRKLTQSRWQAGPRSARSWRAATLVPWFRIPLKVGRVFSCLSVWCF
jgi:hypothetical protein